MNKDTDLSKVGIAGIVLSKSQSHSIPITDRDRLSAPGSVNDL